MEHDERASGHGTTYLHQSEVPSSLDLSLYDFYV